MSSVLPPESSRNWLGLSADALPVAEASAWAIRPDCGAVVTFSGTARDNSAGRPEVSALEYEAYDEQVVPRLQSIADGARTRWPDLGRIVMLHRTGCLEPGETAVVVVVSAPHRDAAFAAARFCIDALKATVPIWKREVWRDGEAWGLESEPLRSVDELSTAGEAGG